MINIKEDLLIDFSLDMPQGEDIKYSDEFIYLENEIQKITSITDTSSVDYEKIKELSIAILKNKSKDFSVACYLCFSLFYENNNSLIDGVDFLTLFIQKYWSVSYPPLKRIKARINMITWLNNKFEKVLLKKIFTKEESLRLISSLEKFQKVLEENLEQDYKVNFLANKDNIKIIQESSNKKNIIDKKIEKEQEMIEELIDTTIIEKKSLERMNLVELNKMYIETLKNSKKVLDLLFEQGLYSIDLFVVNRMLIWNDIKNPPVNEGGITMIPQPAEHQVNYINKLYKDKNWEELLLKCENLIEEHIFWFDLHFYISKSLENLKKSNEQKIVEMLVINFIDKFKEILSFKFKDKKTFFAEKMTILWINNLTSKDTVNTHKISVKELDNDFSSNWLISKYIIINNKNLGELL